ncbi:MAG TPA: alpha/beta hydrolase [Candidatus Binataceae bacterium]|nr:alpha/beta hydrolase [Candidatus Binataceae bacterium]
MDFRMHNMKRTWTILIGILVVAALFLTSLDARAAEQTLTFAGLKVTEWSPDIAPTGPLPIVIFSHGFHGCAAQSEFLTQALASAGYLVFAPDHRDASCGGNRNEGLAPEVPFVHPEQWNDTTYRDRADDIRKLIAALRADEHYNSQIDWSRLGLMGHSLGGYTVLGLAGAWPSWKLDGVKAVLALAPYCHPFVAQKTLGGLESPVMYQGGTADLLITPWISAAYTQSPRPKLLVVFQGATHFAWTNVGHIAHRQIMAYTVDFMNAYLKGEPPNEILTHPTRDVSVLLTDLK